MVYTKLWKQIELKKNVTDLVSNEISSVLHSNHCSFRLVPLLQVQTLVGDKALVSLKHAVSDFCYFTAASIIGSKLLWWWLEVCKLLLVDTARIAKFFQYRFKRSKTQQAYLAAIELIFSLDNMAPSSGLAPLLLDKRTLLIRIRSIKNRISILLYFNTYNSALACFNKSDRSSLVSRDSDCLMICW